jgi:triosephosphate isomerase
MSRRLFIAGNWKMNLSVGDANRLASQLSAAVKDIRHADIAIAPTSLALAGVVEAVKESGIHVASQNHHLQSSGAFTGEVSAEMLKDAGCAYALVGHSERRQIFGETDSLINQKVHAAFRGGLLPILCVGETLEQRDLGQAEAVVKEQVLSGLKDLTPAQMSATTLAYEPVWAIGTGKTASPEEAQQMHAFIRSVLADNFPSFVANDMRIQYGGSVKPHNAAEVLAQPDSDGALVGGASLSVDSFVGILTASLEREP